MRNWVEENRNRLLMIALLSGLPLYTRNVVSDWTAIASTPYLNHVNERCRAALRREQPYPRG